MKKICNNIILSTFLKPKLETLQMKDNFLIFVFGQLYFFWSTVSWRCLGFPNVGRQSGEIRMHTVFIVLFSFSIPFYLFFIQFVSYRESGFIYHFVQLYWTFNFKNCFCLVSFLLFMCMSFLIYIFFAAGAQLVSR